MNFDSISLVLHFYHMDLLSFYDIEGMLHHSIPNIFHVLLSFMRCNNP